MTYRRERWDTEDGDGNQDGDYIDVDWAGPGTADNLLVLFHGVEGDSAAHYARRLGARALRMGWGFAVPHFRGCSGCPNRLARGYYAGDYKEVNWILRRFAQRHARVHAVGVSLGANALLRWLEEYPDESAGILRRAVSLSAPFDLVVSAAALARGFGLFYAGVFLGNDLRQKALDRAARFPGVYDASRVKAARTLREFDDAVTAPLAGFRDGPDYYQRSSAAPLLSEIRVPTLLINAADDPLMPAFVLRNVAQQRDEGRLSPAVELEFPPHGGHAGFLGDGQWLERRVFGFLTRET
jgi:predicted alpha/beta-fold hydrolase